MIRSRVFAILWVLCAGLLPAVAQASSVADFKTQLSNLSTDASKLEFLKTALKGQSLDTKAAVGAWLIESAPAETRKSFAQSVAQTIAGIKDAHSNSPKLAVALIRELPRGEVASLAGPIAIGTAAADPDARPQIAAAVIAAHEKYAAALTGEIIAASPLESASSIAAAIGMTFSDHPNLANQVPEIAAALTRALLPKGPIEKIRPEIAHSIASLIVLLPGSIRSNQAIITRIGKEVAAVIAGQYDALATTIVGVSAAAMKSASGTADIGPVLDGFNTAFKSQISDPVIQGKLDTVVHQVASGEANKDITPLESNQPQAQPLAGSSTDPVAAGFGNSGSLVTAETPTTNR